MMRILVIDNNDSFVYNIVQMLREASAEVGVQRGSHAYRHLRTGCDGVILSPGPGLPAETEGLTEAVDAALQAGIPILGICLGHQALAEHFGARLLNMEAPLHGHPSRLTIVDPDDPLLRNLPDPALVGRYHSWVVDPASLPENLSASSRDEQGNIMSFRHRVLPVHGVQFHPESFISNCGRAIFRNWLDTFRRL